MDYYGKKYRKYKLKYFNLLHQSGGGETAKDVYKIKNAVINGEKLKVINEKYMNKNNKLTPKQYFDICKTAVTSNLSEFEYVLHTEMEVEQYLEICKKILEIAYYFEVPYERYLKICIKAVKNNGLALQHISHDKFKENNNDYICLCYLAVLQNGCALEYVLKDKIKSQDIYLLICEKAVNNNIYALKYIN